MSTSSSRHCRCFTLRTPIHSEALADEEIVWEQDAIANEIWKYVEERGASTKYMAPVYCPDCCFFMETRTEGVDHIENCHNAVVQDGVMRCGMACFWCPPEKGAKKDPGTLRRHLIDCHMKGALRCEFGYVPETKAREAEGVEQDRKTGKKEKETRREWCGHLFTNYTHMTEHRREHAADKPATEKHGDDKAATEEEGAGKGAGKENAPTMESKPLPAWIGLKPFEIVELMTKEEAELYEEAKDRVRQKNGQAPMAREASSPPMIDLRWRLWY